MKLSTTSLVVLSAVLACCGNKEDESAAAQGGMPPRNVETTTVTRSTMQDVLSLVGSVEANESAEIRAEIGGVIESISFEEGQTVKAGDVLATIDQRELQAQLAETESRLQLAKVTRDRLNRLIKSNSVPQAEVDQALSEVSGLEASLDLIRVRLSKTEIRAPFDGIVGSRSVSPGDYVDPTQALTTVVDTSKLKIDFLVPERYYRMLKPGGKIAIRSATTSNGTTLDGTIYFVSSVIDRDTRAAQVKAWIEGETSGLYPGMFTNVDLILEVRENVMTVPEQALLADPRGDSLIVLGTAGENGAHPITISPVRTGLRELGVVEIAPIQPDLVKEGTQIVAAGVGGIPLFPGMSVMPVPMRPAPSKTGSNLQTGSYDEILGDSKDEPSAEKGAESGELPEK